MSAAFDDYTDVTRYTISAREHDAILNVLWRNRQLHYLIETFREKFHAIEKLHPDIYERAAITDLAELLGIVWDHVDMVKECEHEIRALEPRVNEQGLETSHELAAAKAKIAELTAPKPEFTCDRRSRSSAPAPRVVRAAKRVTRRQGAR